MGRRTFGIAILALVLAGLQPAMARAACPTFASSDQVMGHVSDTSLNELSDFVASTDNPGVFWTEEDSSNPNKVYAVNATGQTVGEFTIPGTKDIDWEDISIDRRAGTDLLYVGDIGDNKGTRDGSNTTNKSRVRLYRFPEPTVSATGPKVTGTITGFDTFVYRYADPTGTFIAPRNSESLMTDPITHDVYVVEKTKQTVNGKKQNWIFRLDQPLQNGVINVARKVAFTTTAKTYVSADISPSGDIALKAGTVVYIWPRTQSTVEATFDAHPAAPCTASPIIASEAIGWAPDGLWTVPDGTTPAPIVRLAFAP
ncbi:MAG: hypothetical protein ACRDQE_17120 [Gaiellales bacterium]